MSLSEKAAYLKGLAEGLKIGENSDTEKLLGAIIDAIDEIAYTVDSIDEDIDAVIEQLDAVDGDLAEVEEIVYDLPPHHHFDDDCCCDEDYYEVDCPACGETFGIDDETLDSGSVECPVCGELLEFDADDIDFEVDDED